MAFDYGGMLRPFQIAFLLLSFTTLFAFLFLPYINPVSNQETKTESKSFLKPLKMFIPHRRQVDGRKKWDLNLFFLASGAFFSVLATGYVGMGLQLVATNVFGFKPGDSGLMLVSLSIASRAYRASRARAFGALCE
jgi:heme/copper-type cytochrome/quinol oxidase subunit 3